MTLSSLQKNLSLFQTLKAESEYKGIRKCWWIYGKPGIGKSYAVRSVYPNLYVKAIDLLSKLTGYQDTRKTVELKQTEPLSIKINIIPPKDGTES